MCWVQLAVVIEMERSARNACLSRAFLLLDRTRSSCLGREQLRALMVALRAGGYIAIPEWLVEGADFDDFFDVLDADGSDAIDLQVRAIS